MSQFESAIYNRARILFNRRLFINNYFENIKNTLDIKIAKINSSPNDLNEQENEELNKLYTRFIEEIEAIKNYNLNNLQETNDFLTDDANYDDDNTKKVLFKKFCFLIDLDEALKGDKIWNPCKTKLVTSDFYVNGVNQSYYKSLLRR